MGQETVTFDLKEGYDSAVRRAADVFRRGGLVVFPTETVYGVGARADVEDALARLRQLKGRENGKPFTVHVGRRDDVAYYVPRVSGAGRRLVRRAWPGPLTVIFPVGEGELESTGAVADHGQAGRALYHEGLIGLRCPGDGRARDVLNEAGGPVVAASANAAGMPPPRTVTEAMRDLDARVDLVLDGGATRLAAPSTIVRLVDSGFEVLRTGAYDERSLRRMATLNLLFVCTGNTCRSPMAAAVCERLLSERVGGAEALAERKVAVHSCGVMAGSGVPASREAVEAMERHGIDLSGHRSRPLTVEQINEADHIFAMTQSHLEEIVRMVPSARGRVRLLRDGDIDDPIGGPPEAYVACADQIEAGLRERLEEVEI